MQTECQDHVFTGLYYRYLIKAKESLVKTEKILSISIDQNTYTNMFHSTFPHVSTDLRERTKNEVTQAAPCKKNVKVKKTSEQTENGFDFKKVVHSQNDHSPALEILTFQYIPV